MRPPRSRSPPTRIYTQQQSSDVFTASPSLAQAIARSGRSGGEIINYRVNTSVSVLRFYIYFFRYTIRVTSGGFSRQSFVERIFFSLGLPLSSPFFLSMRLSLVTPPPLLSFLFTYLLSSGAITFRPISSHTLLLRCALLTRHPVRQRNVQSAVA